MEQISQFVTSHPILSFSWIGLFIAVVFLTVKGWMSKIKAISCPAVIDLINNQNAIIVDIRSANNFKQGHITGGYNILPIDIKNGSLGAIAKFKEHPIIVVCDNGVSSIKSATELSKAGFKTVYVLKGGIGDWNNNNLPLIKGNK